MGHDRGENKVRDTVPLGLPTAFLSGVCAAGASALINSIATMGGFAGLITDVNGSSRGGLVVIAVVLAAGGVLALLARHETSSSRASRGEMEEQAVCPHS